LALLVTFVVVRLITRRIRAEEPGRGLLRDIEVGGVHIHHIVYGIGLTLLAGFLEFRFQPDPPWVHLLAIMFGIGAGLMLDEFALSLHMEDVYWSREGRSSVDAVVVALTTGAIFLVHIAPLSVTEAGYETRLGLTVWIAINSVLCSITLLKGKVVTAVIGFITPVVALIGAVRLAKPTSPWARSRYTRHPELMARSEARFGGAYEAWLNRLRDLLGGAPSSGDGPQR
ncbi:MAG: hypothetical protein AB7V62_01940, partial [Thermoleophilia bacterium]